MTRGHIQVSGARNRQRQLHQGDPRVEELAYGVLVWAHGLLGSLSRASFKADAGLLKGHVSLYSEYFVLRISYGPLAKP